MAKRKSRRYFSRFKRRISRRTAGVKSNPIQTLIGCGLYGAARPTIAKAIQPITSKLPFGNYNDEVLLGVGGFLLAMKGRGLLKVAGTSILSSEAYRAGAGIAAGTTATSTSNTMASGWL